MIVVNVAGPLDIVSDGCLLGKVPKKGRALVAYLALAERPVGRELLADLLWPYQGHEQARHSLRNCLLEVRKQLGPAREALTSDFTACALQAETDLHQLNELAASGRYLAAARLVRGDVLEGFEINSEPWEEWLAETRQRMRLLLVPVLTNSSQVASAEGMNHEAIDLARRLVRLDNLNEESHRHLMRILVAAGLRSCALQHFQKLKTLLKAELGVTPDEETCALAAELAASATPPPAPVAAINPVHPVHPDQPDRRLSDRAARVPAAAPINMTGENRLLVSRLNKLAAEIEAWEGGTARLTKNLVLEARAAMKSAAIGLAAAAENIRMLVEQIDEPPPPIMAEERGFELAAA